MMKQNSETNRIEMGVEVSDDMIADRARQLARADGRDDAGASDLEEARAQLMGLSGEIEDDREESLAEDERAGDGSPPTERGVRAPRQELDNETSIAEEEVEEGIAEAELDSREKSHRRE